MIDNNELISTLRERAALYAYGSADSMACTAAANSLEAQAREIERLKALYENSTAAHEETVGRAMKAEKELAAIKAQEPVGYVKETEARNGHGRSVLSVFLPVGTNVFAAPVAPAQPAYDPIGAWNKGFEEGKRLAEQAKAASSTAGEPSKYGSEEMQALKYSAGELLHELEELRFARPGESDWRRVNHADAVLSRIVYGEE